MIPNRILLVDDEPSYIKVIAFDLKKQGYEVSTAGSGPEALTHLEKADVDLVITDLNMKGMSGVQLIGEIKKKKPAIKTMLLTAFGSMESAIEALRLGASDYLLKPHNREELLIKVGHCFENLELQKKVKLYENLLTVCCMCGQFQDDVGKEPDEGEWLKPETYLSRRAKVESTHTYCPECLEEFIKQVKKDQ